MVRLYEAKSLDGLEVWTVIDENGRHDGQLQPSLWWRGTNHGRLTSLPHVSLGEGADPCPPIRFWCPACLPCLPCLLALTCGTSLHVHTRQVLGRDSIVLRNFSAQLVPRRRVNRDRLPKRARRPNSAGLQPLKARSQAHPHLEIVDSPHNPTKTERTRGRTGRARWNKLYQTSRASTHVT